LYLAPIRLYTSICKVRAFELETTSKGKRDRIRAELSTISSISWVAMPRNNLAICAFCCVYNSNVPKLQFELKIGESEISAEVNLPDQPIRPVDLLPVLNAFDDALIGTAVDKVEAAGQRVSCRAGCGACCRQVVPISETEAFHLAGVISAMPEEQRARVTARFAVIFRVLAENGMLDRVKSDASLDPGKLQQMGIDYFRLGLACPFLENESCSIHPDRPSSCREYLVTSPAANCSDPRIDNIDKVVLPARVSSLLYRFGDGLGEQVPRWLPLTLLLDWTSTRSPNKQKAIPAPQLLENFLRKLIPK
jgi:Fe-S-cluster containining protein